MDGQLLPLPAPHKQNGTTVSVNDLARHLPKPLTSTDTFYYTIDTSRVTKEDTEKTSPGVIRAIVEKEIQASNGQTNWRCRAVTRDAKNMSRVKIACRDEAEVHIVKQAAETEIARSVQVLRDELYVSQALMRNGFNMQYPEGLERKRGLQECRTALQANTYNAVDIARERFLAFLPLTGCRSMILFIRSQYWFK